jgi:hypothetical protein
VPLTSPADYECPGTLSPARRVLQAANPLAARRLRTVLAEFGPDVVHLRMFLWNAEIATLAVVERSFSEFRSITQTHCSTTPRASEWAGTGCSGRARIATAYPSVSDDAQTNLDRLTAVCEETQERSFTGIQVVRLAAAPSRPDRLGFQIGGTGLSR